MPFYRGYEYFLEEGLWKVRIDDSIIIVALDDSKLQSNKKIVHSRNSEKACKEYIDWYLNPKY